MPELHTPDRHRRQNLPAGVAGSMVNNHSLAWSTGTAAAADTFAPSNAARLANCSPDCRYRDWPICPTRYAPHSTTRRGDQRGPDPNGPVGKSASARVTNSVSLLETTAAVAGAAPNSGAINRAAASNPAQRRSSPSPAMLAGRRTNPSLRSAQSDDRIRAIAAVTWSISAMPLTRATIPRAS